MARGQPGGIPFTFAVVGRNESATLAGVVAEAQAAAQPGDRVWFVDSASEDDSVELARGLGVEVIEAPRGKGRAIAAALERCDQGYICVIDADLTHWTTNIPAALRGAVVETGADMVVGTYTSDRRRMISPAVYWPLVDALYPDCGRCCDPRPISGLRAFDVRFPIGPLPPGYGVETHLNLSFGAAGAEIVTVDLGEVLNPLRGYSNVEELGSAIVAAILDHAVAHGRLAAEHRPQWERWGREMLDLIASRSGGGEPDAEFLARLARAVDARPLPG